MEDKLFLACEGGLFSKLTTAKYRYGFMYQLRLGCGYLEHATKVAIKLCPVKNKLL